ncbi:MAG: HdeD family acid-resistance protein [Methylosarcina sp.]
MNRNENIDFDIQQMQFQMQNYFQAHWKFFLAEGIFFAVLGFFAVVIPQIFSVAIVIFLGWILLFAGVVQIIRALMFSAMPGFWAWLFIGILQIIVGYLFLAQPAAGILTLTMLIALFFAFEGIAKIYLAFVIRPLPNWSLILISGITALIFAGIISIGWPETAQWLLGLFFGINMIFLGASLIKISWDYKESR